jgi:hypothetical protein
LRILNCRRGEIPRHSEGSAGPIGGHRKNRPERDVGGNVAGSSARLVQIDELPENCFVAPGYGRLRKRPILGRRGDCRVGSCAILRESGTEGGRRCIGAVEKTLDCLIFHGRVQVAPFADGLGGRIAGRSSESGVTPRQVLLLVSKTSVNPVQLIECQREVLAEVSGTNDGIADGRRGGNQGHKSNWRGGKRHIGKTSPVGCRRGRFIGSEGSLGHREVSGKVSGARSDEVCNGIVNIDVRVGREIRRQLIGVSVDKALQDRGHSVAAFARDDAGVRVGVYQ